MPTVPKYGSSPQVDQGPTPVQPQRSSASAALLGTGARELSGVGQQLTQVGDIGARIAVDIQTRNNADMVFRASANLRDGYAGFESQAKQRLGANAKDLTKDANEWWDSAVAKAGEGLENDAQRRLFEHQATPLRQASIESFSMHEGVQMRKSLTESASADTVSATNIAVANPYNGAMLENSRATIVRNAGVASSLNGWTKEKHDAELSGAITKMHMGVLGAMVDRDPKSATAYYKTRKGEIDGTQHAQIEKTLEIGGIRQRTQNYADEILAKNLSQDESIKLAETSYEGVERDETVRRVNEKFSQKRAAREGAQKDASDTGWKYYDQGGINAVPTTILAAMDPKEKQSMEDYARARQNQNEADIFTDYEKYSGLMTMAATSPAEFLKENPNNWRSSMNTQDWNTLRGVYNTVLASKGKPPPNLMTANSIADSFTKQSGLTGPQNAQNAAFIKAEIMNGIALAQSIQPDKHLSDEQMTSVAVRTFGGLRDRNAPQLAVTAKPEALTVQNRTVEQYAARVLEAGNASLKGPKLTAQRNTFKTIADEVLGDKRRKAGGALSDDTVRRTLDFLMREGSITTEYGDDLDDAEGYFFEFLGREDVDKFVPDKQ